MATYAHTLTDQELTLRLQGGQIDALDLIYQRYAKDLYTVAYSLLRDKTSCEDIVHDLFVDMWQRRDFHQIVVLKAYLFRATKNRVLMHLRSKKIVVDIASVDEAREPFSNHEILLEKEIQAIILTAMEQLPEKCREIFYLSRMEQKSHKEIAELKGISTKTIENQITIALRRLRPALKDYVGLLLLLESIKH